jgi:hypothetical protein
MVQVGSYTPPDENGNGEKIERAFYGQGSIFKSDEAFYDTEHPDRVCYIPELSDTKYSREDFLRMCNEQTDLAEELYEAVDWQHPETLLDEWWKEGELDACKKCGKMFNCYGATKCPYCGAEYEDKENAAS